MGTTDPKLLFWINLAKLFFLFQWPKFPRTELNTFLKMLSNIFGKLSIFPRWNLLTTMYSLSSQYLSDLT